MDTDRRAQEARAASTTPVTVELLLASPRSRYVGRPADGPAPVPTTGHESHDDVTVRAHLGIVGDRYFNAPAHRGASVTLFAAEQLEHVARELGLPPGARLDAALARRNVVVRGVDVDALVGYEFDLDTGDGPVSFRATRAANPCAWMDVVFGTGAFRALRGRGGVRCEPLTDGVLRVGPGLLRAS
ncbi:MOSC domain-containing protein [Frigoribacterium sp. MEB024]|uniref:MOSC domain-containing protein n=1 Tax=Frigoribacterium sp. MEB024 TaxID=1589899 RepID=UPI0005B8BF45|nr:MOSC domain-containing protein [Frigoribacterium sp. MEB024]